MPTARQLLTEYNALLYDLASHELVTVGKNPFEIHKVSYQRAPYTVRHVERKIDLATHNNEHFKMIRTILSQTFDLRERLDHHVANSVITLPRTKKVLQNLRYIYSTLREKAIEHAAELLRAASDAYQGVEVAGSEVTPTHTTIRQVNPAKNTLDKLITLSRKHLQALQDMPE